jgi:glycine dehydrogenase subunit 2
MTVANRSTTASPDRAAAAAPAQTPFNPVKTQPRQYHAPRWDEPLIHQLSTPGARGMLVPAPLQELPEDAPEARIGRDTRVELPEIGQAQVLRHFLRLSQETLGADLNVDIGQGTCTMKYSPKINERFAAAPQSAGAHPRQAVETVQGTLRILKELQDYLAEVSGMDAISLQAGSGSAAIFGNVSIVRAYHRERGEEDVRDEVITTIYSHPSNAATARTMGYKVITLYPDGNGFPDLEALRAAVSERTAALFITNPEDTGIFNPRITDYVDAVHEVGGLCVYDQANANGLLGIARAREAGFDLCHFNLHKTFSTPHACGGPAAGAIGARSALAPYLPGRRVVAEGTGYRFAQRDPRAIADIRPGHGVIPNLIRAYAWIRALGGTGLREVSDIAVLNNNYLLARMLEIPGLDVPYAKGKHRLEQVRYSWQPLADDTGVSSGELGAAMADHGFHYWTSHHPYIVPEPLTLEPTESYAKAEIDEYVDALRDTAALARVDPDEVRTAPHRSSIHTVDQNATTDPDTWVTSWRAYQRKYEGRSFPQPERWTPAADLPVPERAPKAHHR